MFARAALAVPSPSLVASQLSSRRIVSLAQSLPRTATTTVTSFSTLTSLPASNTAAVAPSSLVKTLYHHQHSSTAYSSFTSPSFSSAATSTSLRRHTNSLTTRSIVDSYHATSTRSKHSKTSLFSRPYTSSSSSSASSSTAAGTTARLLAEETSSQTATATKAPLTFHEEMTKVRFSFNWWKEWTIIMGVFAVTGSSTVMFVRPILKDVFKLEGSMTEGPWSFRIAYLSTTLPLYSCVLLTVATIAGRRPYFKKVVLRMWGRFLPKKVIQRFQ